MFLQTGSVCVGVIVHAGVVVVVCVNMIRARMADNSKSFERTSFVCSGESNSIEHLRTKTDKVSSQLFHLGLCVNKVHKVHTGTYVSTAPNDTHTYGKFITCPPPVLSLSSPLSLCVFISPFLFKQNEMIKTREHGEQR